jgi:hypothetical protein
MHSSPEAKSPFLADVQHVLPAFTGTEASPYINIIVNFPKRAMQLFLPDKEIAQDPDFFSRPNKVLPLKFTAADNTMVKGGLTFMKNVFVDTNMLNQDPVQKIGECYARDYSLRAHVYVVALLYRGRRILCDMRLLSAARY